MAKEIDVPSYDLRSILVSLSNYRVHRDGKASLAN